MANIEKRVDAQENMTYRVRVRLKGYPTQTATFKRLTDARRWAQQTEVALQEGHYFNSTEAKRHTVSATIERYIDEVLREKPGTYRDRIGHLNWWKDKLGEYALSALTPSLITKKRQALKEEQSKRGKARSLATVNRYLASLSHVMTIAVQEWEWLDKNPLRKVSKLAEPRGRVRFLSEEERDRLLAACKDYEHAYLELIVILCLSTGARRNEILKLKWSQIDLERGVIVLSDTKNKERRSLPLTEIALERMKAHAEDWMEKSAWVFPSHKKPNQPLDIRKAWEGALRKAKIEDFRFHDLRHTAASWLAMNGATTSEIAEVLGHKTLQMVKRYAHLSDSHVSKVVARMNKKMLSTLS